MLLSYSARRRGRYAVSAIDLCSRAFGNSHLLASRINLETHARRLAVPADDCDVGQVDRRLFRDDAAFLGLGLLLVTLHEVDATDESFALGRTHLEYLAAATLVAARQHDDLVALPDFRSHHSTSGASEMIFMWFLARSSRGTGPKIRVPTGSDWLLISTAALRSKRMTEPSGRRMSLRTRTTTAFITSPFFTLPRGIASLMDMTRRAPELSATSRLVCI